MFAKWCRALKHWPISWSTDALALSWRADIPFKETTTRLICFLEVTKKEKTFLDVRLEGEELCPNHCYCACTAFWMATELLTKVSLDLGNRCLEHEAWKSSCFPLCRDSPWHRKAQLWSSHLGRHYCSRHRVCSCSVWDVLWHLWSLHKPSIQNCFFWPL